MLNVMRGVAVDEAVQLGSGENPWKANPARGCRMKQACKSLGGANRREREKRCGRNVRRVVERSLLVDSR